MDSMATLPAATGSRNKDFAWVFLRFAVTPERDLAIPRHGRIGIGLSTWRDAELRSRIPPYCEIETISLDARQLPTFPKMAASASIIDVVATRALTGNDTPAAILESAQHQIEHQGIRFT
jgi:multiple sugar transport system substrate-binding protein